MLKNRSKLSACGAAPVLGVLAATALLTGCAGLPTDGSVHESEIKAGNNQLILGLSAPGPAEDATVEQIVTGFIRACAAGYSDDFTVARSFLSTRAALDWHPDKQVQIFDTDSQLEFTRRADGSVVVHAKSVGGVDANGSYTVADSQAEISEIFSLVKGADNQWRIASLSDGVLLSQAAFTAVYTSSPVYFLTKGAQALVPDLRWYPKRYLPTHLVNALLSGPLDNLEGAVTSSLGPGSTLRGGVVEVLEGVAHVSLNLTEPLDTAEQIAKVYWQMEATLVGVSGITSVVLSQGSTPIENQRPRTATVSTKAPVLIHQGNLVRYRGGNTEFLVSGAVLAGEELANPGISADGKIIVFTDKSETKVYSWGRNKAQEVFSGRKVIPPTVDRSNWIWTADLWEPRQITVISGAGERIDLPVPWSAQLPLKSFAISPDGTQIAAILEAKEGSKVELVTVIRDVNGRPLELRFPRDMVVSGNNVISLDWLNGYSLAMLNRAETGVEVLLVPVVGPATALPGIKEAVDLTAGSGESEIYLFSAAGDLYQRAGRTWRQELAGDSASNQSG